LSLLTKKKFRGLISISKNKKKHQKITSIPKIKRLVEILMFNLKNESHVQVAKKKKMDIIHICFKTFDINLFFLKKRRYIDE
jgi:hypothetical protein